MSEKNNTVGRKELAAVGAEELNISVAQADRHNLTLLNAIARALHSGKRVNVTGFGSFTPVTRAARTARNPQTGEPMQVPERITIKFVPGARLSDTLNGVIEVPDNGVIVTKSPKSF